MLNFGTNPDINCKLFMLIAYFIYIFNYIYNVLKAYYCVSVFEYIS